MNDSEDNNLQFKWKVKKHGSVIEVNEIIVRNVSFVMALKITGIDCA
jgi:hypothetical protein